MTVLSLKIVRTCTLPNTKYYHLHVIMIAGLSSNVSGQSPSYTYKSDAIQKQAANTRWLYWLSSPFPQYCAANVCNKVLPWVLADQSFSYRYRDLSRDYSNSRYEVGIKVPNPVCTDRPDIGQKTKTSWNIGALSRLWQSSPGLLLPDPS